MTHTPHTMTPNPVGTTPTPEQAYCLGTKGRDAPMSIRQSPCLLACYRAGLEEGGRYDAR